MPPAALALAVSAYFLVLLAVAWRTSRGADEQAFFVGSRRSPWPLVAFGMIGTSLSGVTFVSVPGSVGTGSWHYLQIVLGHVIGYAIVAFVLLPLYYRLNLTSIYGYLEARYGPEARATGAVFFLVSRALGATARLYLVVRILQDVAFAGLGLPFWATTLVILAMIVLYTLEGGVKTIVWTDTLQTAGMLTGLVACTAVLLGRLELSPLQALDAMRSAGLATVFATDVASPAYWLKHLVAGVFIAVAMTGLDQEMMQKNISVRTVGGAQLNMIVMSLILLGVVTLFLFLGGALHLYAQAQGIAVAGDRLFPAVVTGHLPALLQLVFVLALISALFPSADGALTALTSSTCIDLMRVPERAGWTDAQRRRTRRLVHLAWAVLFFALVLGFRALDDPVMVGLILKIAAYTYGPLLGLYAFGLLCTRRVRPGWTPWIALASPLLCAALDAAQPLLFTHYRIGLEILVINGALTAAGLWLASRPAYTACP
ncbi:MAG: sodium:solute symporter [Rubrivivax sp.]|jgi:Na+/proline symporter|nr:sodium:solute symporter [Rubrivivax sp.]